MLITTINKNTQPCPYSAQKYNRIQSIFEPILIEKNDKNKNKLNIRHDLQHWCKLNLFSIQSFFFFNLMTNMMFGFHFGSSEANFGINWNKKQILWFLKLKKCLWFHVLIMIILHPLTFWSIHCFLLCYIMHYRFHNVSTL